MVGWRCCVTVLADGSLQLLKLLLELLDLLCAIPHVATICALGEAVLNLATLGGVGEIPPILIRLHQISVRSRQRTTTSW